MEEMCFFFSGFVFLFHCKPHPQKNVTLIKICFRRLLRGCRILTEIMLLQLLLLQIRLFILISSCFLKADCSYIKCSVNELFVKGGATHVDIACDPDLVKLATSLTSLTVNHFHLPAAM